MSDGERISEDQLAQLLAWVEKAGDPTSRRRRRLRSLLDGHCARSCKNAGDGEAWRLLVKAAEQAATDLDALVSDHAEALNDQEHERLLRLKQQVRTTKAHAAKCSALLARRAACRARGDEGDGATIDHDEAYGLWQAAEREHQRTKYAVVCLSPTALSAERQAVYAAQRSAEIALLRARLVHLEAIDQLLGRAAATATPAGEETER